MTVKRRSHGRNKKGRGHVNRVRCVSTGKAIPKDKAIKRFQMRQMVDASSRRDIKENSAYDVQHFNLPKIYVKLAYCVSCGIHARVVRARSSLGRAGAKGDRYKRYTTKLRQNVSTFEALTGTAAIALGDPHRLQFLIKGGRDKPRGGN